MVDLIFFCEHSLLFQRYVNNIILLAKGDYIQRIFFFDDSIQVDVFVYKILKHKRKYNVVKKNVNTIITRKIGVYY